MATENVHIRRIVDTWSNVLSGLDDGQTAIANNLDGDPHVWREGNDFFFPAVGKSYNTSTTNWTFYDVDFNAVTAYGDLTVAEYIKHHGDADTYQRFTPDDWTLVCGGVQMIAADEDTQDALAFSATSQDVDLSWSWVSGVGLFCEGSSGKIGIGTNTIDSLKAHIYYNGEANHQTRAGGLLLIENAREGTSGHAGIVFQAGTDDDYDWFSVYADWNSNTPKFSMYDPYNSTRFLEYSQDDFRVTLGEGAGLAAFVVRAQGNPSSDWMEFGSDKAGITSAALSLPADVSLQYYDALVDVFGDGDYCVYHSGAHSATSFIYSNNDQSISPISNVLMQYYYEDAVTDTITWMARYTHYSTGTSAEGFGTGIEMEIENANCGVDRIGGLSYEYTTNYAIDESETQWRFWVDGDGTKYSVFTVAGYSYGPGGGYPFVRAGVGPNFDNPGTALSNSFDIIDGNGESVFHVKSQTGGIGACIVEGNTGAWSYWIDNGGAANEKILALGIDAGVGVFQSVNDNTTTLKDNMLAFDLSSGYVGIGLNDPGAPLHIGISSALTGIAYPLFIGHRDSSTYATGDGVGLRFTLGGTSSCFEPDDVAGGIESYTIDPETDSRTIIAITAMNQDYSSGAATRCGWFGLDDSGYAEQYLGDPETNGSWKSKTDGTNILFQLRASGTYSTIAAITPTALRIPVKASTGDPASGSAGDMYINTTDQVVKIYTGSAWLQIAAWI